MPIFEFVCSDCEKEFELLVRSAASKNNRCPHCSSKKLTKKFSVFASATASTTTSAPAVGACGMPRSPGCGCCGPHHHH